MRAIHTGIFTFGLLFYFQPAESASGVTWEASTTSKKFEPRLYAFQNGLGFGSASEEAQFLKQSGYAGVCQVFDQGAALASRVAAYEKLNLRVASVYLNVNDTPILESTIKPLANRDAILELTIQKMSPKTVAAVRQTASMAEKLNIRVALYPHHGNAVATILQALELVEKVNHSNLGVMFNLCHFLKSEKAKDFESVLENAAPHLFSVSICGADLDGKNWDTLIQPLGKGSFPQKRLMDALEKLNYKGPVGLQCYAIKGDKPVNLKNSIEAWKKILGEFQ